MTDIRTSDQDVNRAIRSWLHEDRHEDASRLAGAVLDDVEATPQRRSTWWPARRMPIMSKSVTLGLGAAAVVVLFLVGAQLFRSPAPGVGARATPTPSPEPSATASPTPSPSSAAPLTQTFRSTRHGISLSYPEGWTAQAATEPWTDPTVPLNFMASQADVMYDPTLADHLFVLVASQAIGDSAPEDWVAEQMASEEGCAGTEPIDVDGATGLIGVDDCNSAVVTTAGRGYWIALYTSGDEAWLATTYDRAWFEELLASVQLHPKKAVDTAP